MLDPDGCILLQRIRTPAGRDIWITPGGALEPGETHSQAARREALEEIGLDVAHVVGPVWTRRHVFDWGETRYDQREQYFLICLDRRVEATPTIAAEQLAAEGIAEHRWWTPDEIEASLLAFAPRRMAERVRELTLNGPPADPVDVGV